MSTHYPQRGPIYIVCTPNRCRNAEFENIFTVSSDTHYTPAENYESNEQTIAKQASDAELHLPLNRHLYD